MRGGDNVGIEDSREGSIRKVKIELKTPLDQKLLTSDIEGLDTLLSGKQEKIAGKSLLADSEILRLKNDLSGKASGINTGDETVTSIKSKLGIVTLSGVNTGDQDLSGLVPKTDIKTDFSGGAGKVAGAKETKQLYENKADRVFTINSGFNPVISLKANTFITLVGTEADPVDVNLIYKSGTYILEGWVVNLPVVFGGPSAGFVGSAMGNQHDKAGSPLVLRVSAISDAQYMVGKQEVSEGGFVFTYSCSRDINIEFNYDGSPENWTSIMTIYHGEWNEIGYPLPSNTLDFLARLPGYWFTPTLYNGWTSVDAGNSVKFRTNGDFLEILGRIRPGTLNSRILRFGSNYRAAQNTKIPVVSSTGNAYLSIEDDGTLTEIKLMNTAAGEDIYLSFRYHRINFQI